MAHLPDFISDLALILITAGIVTIIFKWLKQPVVLGYIVAGFLASPHLKHGLESIVKNIGSSGSDRLLSYLSHIPSVSDMGNIEIWSEIGVIFLLFALGLEFSFKKLLDVGGTASIATLINMGSMIAIGYVVGKLLGWTEMDSIFLGGMLSMSSTTIIIKAFNDMSLQKKKFANIVFGMLIVEDLAAILMMVLLSTLAVSQHFEGMELLNSLLKLMFFMLVWFIVGIYLIPTFLKKLKKYLNDETLLIFAVGLCLGMVLFATQVGFSAALGAFIMGSILAETIESKHIEHLVEPLKNLFGAVFFVSVGMMIDPKVIMDYAGIIVLLTVVVLTGRVIFATLGVMASGQGLKVAVQSGFSLAQIGEFSFIIATLGMSLGVISDILYPIIVAVSVITTFTTPYFIKMSPAVAGAIEKVIPEKWNKLVAGYASSNYKSVNKQNDWNKLLKNILGQTAIYFTLSLAVLLLAETLLIPFIRESIPGILGRIISAIVTLLLMAPFLRAMIVKKNKSEEFKSLWHDSTFNRGALISLTGFRIILGITLILTLLIPLFPAATPLLVLISVVIALLIIFSQGFKKQSRKMEERFLENLTRKQVYDEQNAAILPNVENDLLSKDIHVEEFEIPQTSAIIGKTLQELNFRQRTGVSIITIIRGDQKINIPDANERIYPFDKLVVAGSDEELHKLTQTIEERKKDLPHCDISSHHISLSQYVVEKDSFLAGKSIEELKIREKTECMVIGIDRGNQSIVHFDPGFILQEGDVLWLAGEKYQLKTFGNNIKKQGNSILQ